MQGYAVMPEVFHQEGERPNLRYIGKKVSPHQSNDDIEATEEYELAWIIFSLSTYNMSF